MRSVRNLSKVVGHLRGVGVAQNHPSILTTSSTLAFSKRYQHAQGVTPQERKNFMDMFPIVVQDLKNYAAGYSPSPAPDWFERSLKYNVSHGKNNRGLLTILAFKELAREPQRTPENYKRAQLLGWCMELLTGSLLAFDDVMDGSLTRRKQTSWYRLDDVGMQAINDCLMIEAGLYHLLDKYFRDTDYCMKLMELFREVTFATAVGQALDIRAPEQNITEFTMENYKTLCRTKSSYATFSLPVFLSMHICGITDEQTFIETDKVLFEICYFFQAENDFEDCYGDPKITKRVGTDIEDNRFTWLATKAVSLADKRQLKILKKCYGHQDPAKVKQVRQVYDELNMPELFDDYRRDCYNFIKSSDNITSGEVKPEFFVRIWEQFFGRMK